jgi:hypothetical protein
LKELEAPLPHQAIRRAALAGSIAGRQCRMLILEVMFARQEPLKKDTVEYDNFGRALSTAHNYFHGGTA